MTEKLFTGTLNHNQNKNKTNFWGVKFIDCKNYSILVALPFNKELYSEVLSQNGLRAPVGVKI